MAKPRPVGRMVSAISVALPEIGVIVAAIRKAKGYQGHFERDTHDPDRLRVELVAI